MGGDPYSPRSLLSAAAALPFTVGFKGHSMATEEDLEDPLNRELMISLLYGTPAFSAGGVVMADLY